MLIEKSGVDNLMEKTSVDKNRQTQY